MAEKAFSDYVQIALQAMREELPPIPTLLGGWGVVMFFAKKLWVEISIKPEQRSEKQIMLTLTSIGAAAQRVAEDCGLVEMALLDVAPSPQGEGGDPLALPEREVTPRP